jgi:flagellar motor switch protein FliM
MYLGFVQKSYSLLIMNTKNLYVSIFYKNIIITLIYYLKLNIMQQLNQALKQIRLIQTAPVSYEVSCVLNNEISSILSKQIFWVSYKLNIEIDAMTSFFFFTFPGLFQ